MPITDIQKNKILQVVNVFETGSKDGNYAKVSIYEDGPVGADGKRVKQVTYGRSQTTEFGLLKKLIEMYVQAKGQFAADFKPYIQQLGKQPSLHTDKTFIKLLKDAGNLDPVMATTQDSFFDKLYYEPAVAWFEGMGFTHPLSLLVIYDSQIHSGSILAFLRERFAESVPKNGGKEEKWIQQYVDVRHDWLATHKNKILQNTVYRTQCFKDAIAAKNWDLSKPIAANKIIIS